MTAQRKTASRPTPALPICLVCALGLGTASAGPVEERAAHLREAMLLLKVLSYDYTLAERCRTALRIGIVYWPDAPPSVATAHAIYAAFVRLSEDRFTVHRLPVKVSLVPLPRAGDRGLAARKSGVNAIYFAPSLPPEALTALLELARAQRWATLSGLAEHPRRGVAVAAVRQDRGFRILINRKAAEQQGSKFSAQIFKVAELVSGAP